MARNVGAAAATADYLLFLDADDLLAPRALEELLAVATTVPGALVAMGTVAFVEDPGRPLETSLPPATFFPTIAQTNLGPPNCWMCPRPVFVTLGGFREDINRSEDWEFLVRVALAGVPLASTEYPGALYRRHPGSQVATSTRVDVLQGRLVVLETLAEGMLARRALLLEHGASLFWTLRAVWLQARAAGVSRDTCGRSAHWLRRIAAARPAGLTDSWFARVAAVVGMIDAERLLRISGRDKSTGGMV